VQSESQKLIREIRRVSDARIARCEIAHLLDSVDGRFIAVVDSRFFKQVAAMLTKEMIEYGGRYEDVSEDDLSAEEVVQRRHAELRMSLLEDIYCFELDAAVVGKVTQEEWLRMRTDSKIVRGWQVWICHEKKRSRKTSKTTKAEPIGVH